MFLTVLDVFVTICLIAFGIWDIREGIKIASGKSKPSASNVSSTYIVLGIIMLLTAIR